MSKEVPYQRPHTGIRFDRYGHILSSQVPNDSNDTWHRERVEIPVSQHGAPTNQNDEYRRRHSTYKTEAYFSPRPESPYGLPLIQADARSRDPLRRSLDDLSALGTRGTGNNIQQYSISDDSYACPPENLRQTPPGTPRYNTDDYDRGYYEYMRPTASPEISMTPAIFHRPHPKKEDVTDDGSNRNPLRSERPKIIMEGEDVRLIIDKTKQRETRGGIKINIGVEDENKTAAQAKEAKAMQDEELAKRMYEKVEGVIDKIMVLFENKIQQIGTEKQTDAKEHARQTQLPDEDQVKTEEVDGQKATVQDVQQVSPQPSHPDPPELSAPSANFPHRSSPSKDHELSPRRPPSVPNPPRAYVETESEKRTVSASPSRKMHRFEGLEQGENSQERKERKTLGMIREELVLPMAEMLADIAKTANRHAAPAPTPPHQTHYFHSYGVDEHYSRSTRRRHSSDPESTYSESESSDVTDMPRRFMRAGERTLSRGRPLRRIERTQYEMKLSLPHRHPHPAERDEETSTQKDNRVQLIKAGLRPTIPTTEPTPTQQENTGRNVLEETTTGEDLGNITKVKIIINTAAGLIQFRINFLFLLSLLLLIFFLLLYHILSILRFKFT